MQKSRKNARLNFTIGTNEFCDYRTPKMFIVKMEGFAGFVGLMFGLVVLSVIITLVVCAVKRHRREWLQDGQRRV